MSGAQSAEDPPWMMIQDELDESSAMEQHLLAKVMDGDASKLSLLLHPLSIGSSTGWTMLSSVWSLVIPLSGGVVNVYSSQSTMSGVGVGGARKW